MSVLISTNTAATLAANNLASSNSMLQRSLNRLSSGSKIVNPADDAGGLAVSMKLSAAAKRQGAAASNIGNSVSFLQSQDGALKVAGKVLERIGELKTLASDPTKNASDLANYNAEFAALQSQLTSLSAEKFNGVSLFGSNDLVVGTTEDGSGSVTAKGIELLATPAFPALTDNFADLSQWSDDSFGGSAYVSGNVLNLDGAFGIVTSNQSFSEPFEINLEFQSKSAGDILAVWLGDTGTIIGAANPGDTNWHSMRITFDGTTTSAYIDGASTPSMTANPSPNSGPIQLSSNAASGIRVRDFSVTSADAGAAGNVSSVTTASDLTSLSLTSLTSALSDIATYRAENGASQSRLGFASEVLSVNKANLEAANSRIMDVDVAEESTQLARWNVLVQAGTSMLAQANQSPQAALRLLG